MVEEVSNTKKRQVLGLSTSELFWSTLLWVICTVLLQDDARWAMVGTAILALVFGLALIVSVVRNLKREGS